MTPLDLLDWFYFDALMSPLSWWAMTAIAFRVTFRRV